MLRQSVLAVLVVGLFGTYSPKNDLQGFLGNCQAVWAGNTQHPLSPSEDAWPSDSQSLPSASRGTAQGQARTLGGIC